MSADADRNSDTCRFAQIQAQAKSISLQVARPKSQKKCLIRGNFSSSVLVWCKGLTEKSAEIACQ